MFKVETKEQKFLEKHNLKDVVVGIEESKNGIVVDPKPEENCKSIKCYFYDNNMECNCSANEDLCEKCMNSQLIVCNKDKELEVEATGTKLLNDEIANIVQKYENSDPKVDFIIWFGDHVKKLKIFLKNLKE